MFKYFILIFVIIFTAQTTKAQLFGVIPINHFEKGFYYDLNNKKVSGKIAKDASARNTFASETYILFKSDSAAGDRVRLTPKMIRSFVVGVDSFTVAHDSIPQFYRVVFDGSNVKIFSVSDFGGSSAPMQHMTANGMTMGGVSGTAWKTSKYFYGPDPEHIMPLVRRNFIEIMSQVMADQPIIVQKLKDKAYGIGDIKDLITDYKTVKAGQPLIKKASKFDDF